MNQKEKHFVHIVQYQKISMLPHRMDWNFLGGRGSLRPKNLKKCIKFNRNFQRGGGVGLGKNPFHGRGIDIFWNYTLHSGGETQNTLKIMIFLTLVTRITHPNVNQTSGIVF